MIAGMTTFTFSHVLISLIAIGSGLCVVYGMIAGQRLNGMTALFLLTTGLTSITGFLFPFHGFTPGIGVGIISLIVLAVAIMARYQRHLMAGWRRIYVITAVLALYLNCFVLVVQLFEKVPSLHAMAPKGSEPPFAVAQFVVLAIFVALGIAAVKGFRETPQPLAKTPTVRAA